MIEMKKEGYKNGTDWKEGFTFTEGGVCAAKGFLANGLNCGLNSDQNKNDLCLIMSESECSAAAVYTQNKVKVHQSW